MGPRGEIGRVLVYADHPIIAQAAFRAAKLRRSRPNRNTRPAAKQLRLPPARHAQVEKFSTLTGVRLGARRIGISEGHPHQDGQLAVFGRGKGIGSLGHGFPPWLGLGARPGYTRGRASLRQATKQRGRLGDAGFLALCLGFAFGFLSCRHYSLRIRVTLTGCCAAAQGLSNLVASRGIAKLSVVATTEASRDELSNSAVDG